MHKEEAKWKEARRQNAKCEADTEVSLVAWSLAEKAGWLAAGPNASNPSYVENDHHRETSQWMMTGAFRVPIVRGRPNLLLAGDAKSTDRETSRGGGWLGNSSSSASSISSPPERASERWLAGWLVCFPVSSYKPDCVLYCVCRVLFGVCVCVCWRLIIGPVDP